MSEVDPRKTVYLLHGLMGSCTAHFGSQIMSWAGTHRVVPIDLPGHGKCRSDAAPDYYREAVKMVVGVLERQGAGNLVSVSYLGGTVAVRVALERPDLVRSAVVSGFAYDVPADAFSNWAGAFVALASARADIAEGYLALHGPRWCSTLDHVVRDIKDNYDATVRTSSAMLTGLAVPMRLVNGTQKSNEHAAALAVPKLSARISARVVDGAGHMVPFDRPAAFREAVEGFWTELGG